MDRLLMMEAFVRVVDAGSFSAAARSWGRSKAVVSKYVARLEAHLDAQLLRRTTRSLSLTDAGRDYHGRCVALLGELESMEASVTQAGTALSGALRVSVPPGFALTHLPLLVLHPPPGGAIPLEVSSFEHVFVPLDGSDAYKPVKSGPYLMGKFKSTGA